MAWIYKPKRKNNLEGNRAKRQDVYNTSLWRKMRLAKLMEQPLCEVCLLVDKVTLAEHAHHLKSFMQSNNINERDQLAYDSQNLLSVCAKCHNRIHNGDLKGCDSVEEIKERLKQNDNNEQSL